MDRNERHQRVTQLNTWLEFEEKHDLFSRRYNGDPYWHAIRIAAYTDILSARGYWKKRRTSITRKICKACILFWNACCSMVIARQTTADILVQDINRYAKIEGRDVDVFMDWIREEYNCATLTYGMARASKLKRGYPNSSIIELTFILYFYFCKSIGNKTDIEEKMFLDTLQKEIEKQFGVEIENLHDRALRFILLLNVYTKYFQAVLKRVRPKLVIIVGSTLLANHAMIQSARKFGIAVVELMHGAAGHDNIGYNFPSNLSKAPFLPTHILTFGEYWIDAWRMPKGTRCIPTGFVHMDTQRKRKEEINNHGIVFYSNYNTMVAEILEEFIKLSKDHSFEIIYKLHPQEYIDWKERYPNIEKMSGDIKIIDYAMNVYDLFLTNKYHVGKDSTTLFEAIGMGKTVFSHYSGNESMRDMIELGLVKEFSTAEELFKMICDANIQEESCFDGEKRKRNITNIFAENAKENQKSVIDSILRGEQDDVSI